MLQGGKGLPSNMFHITYRGAVYAIDIVKLNKYGNRASSVFSRNLTDYEIYADTIYSPCDGRILSTHDDNPDNIPHQESEDLPTLIPSSSKLRRIIYFLRI